MAHASFHSDRRWVFPLDRAGLWDRLTATDDYRAWWPWLRRLDAGAGFVEHERWTCVVAPPLPYTVSFHLDLDRVVPEHSVESTVSGDIGGWARLTLADGVGDGEGGTGGCSARLVSSLHPTNPLLRGVGLVARPLVEYGHNWVLDEGRRQFVERAVTLPNDG